MEIKLERNISIQRYRVLLELEKAEKRDELLPVLMLFRDNGSVSAKDVVQHLLDDMPELVGKRLLSICEKYGLLEKRRFNNFNYSLTEKGQEALDKQQVFVPEKGVWELWVTDDPLWQPSLLKIERFKELSAKQETDNSNREALEKRTNSKKKFPSKFQDRLKQSGFITTLLGGDNYRFHEFEENAELIENTEMAVSVTLTIPQHGNTSLVFSHNGKSYHQDAPDLTFDEIWQQMLEAEFMWDAWDEVKSAWRIAYNEQLKPTERTTFLKSHTFQKPELIGLNQFEPCTVENIEIAPATQQDADNWAIWLLEQSVNRYLTQGEFSKMQDEVRAKFPDFDVSLPSQKVLAQNLRESNRNAFWYLQAPLDWQIA